MDKYKYIVRIPEINKELRIKDINQLLTFTEIMFNNGYEFVEMKRNK